jgi:hypothetical protein
MKILLKKVYLKIYFLIFNSLTELKKKIRIYFIQKKILNQIEKGYLNVFLNSDWLGLGARIVKTIELLNFAELKKIELNIKYGYKEKYDSDYFRFLFHFKTNRKYHNKKYIQIEDSNEIVKNINLNNLLSIDKAYSLFEKHLVFEQSILSEVDAYCKDNFINYKVLGVHYRGTDKSGEAPRFNEDMLITEIENCLINNSFDKVFISTDEQKILEIISNRFKNIDVIFRADALRSDNGDQFHRKPANSKEIVNRDAIANILILSRTHFLLKTASIMSDCCFIFNPELQYKILSMPHNDDLTWWPASELKNKVS